VLKSDEMIQLFSYRAALKHLGVEIKDEEIHPELIDVTRKYLGKMTLKDFNDLDRDYREILLLKIKEVGKQLIEKYGREENGAMSSEK
jgi:hypothetical protein